MCHHAPSLPSGAGTLMSMSSLFGEWKPGTGGGRGWWGLPQPARPAVDLESEYLPSHIGPPVHTASCGTMGRLVSRVAVEQTGGIMATEA